MTIWVGENADAPFVVAMASQRGLDDTTAAIQGLQRSLEPWVSILQQDEGAEVQRPSPQSVAKAQTLLALTLATLCFLKPRLMRASKVATTPALITSSNNQQQIQIRSDLNHIRRLLSSLESRVSSSETTETPMVSASLTERHTATASSEAAVTALEPKNFTKRKAEALPAPTSTKKSCKKRKMN
jgi:hypothetical protein